MRETERDVEHLLIPLKKPGCSWRTCRFTLSNRIPCSPLINLVSQSFWIELLLPLSHRQHLLTTHCLLLSFCTTRSGSLFPLLLPEDGSSQGGYWGEQSVVWRSRKTNRFSSFSQEYFSRALWPFAGFYLNLAGKNHRRLASWRGAFPACFPLLSHCKFRAPGCWTIVENDRLDGEAVCTGQFQAMATVGRFELTKSVFQSITRLLLSFRWPC